MGHVILSISMVGSIFGGKGNGYRAGNYPVLMPAAFVFRGKSRVQICSNSVGKVEARRV